MDVGALSLLISEKGFDATMAKVAALDAAAAKVGAKQAELRVISPTALAVEAALARVGATATRVSGAPVSVRLALTGLPEALGGLGGVETAKARVSGTPVTTTATPPNLAPITSALAGLELAKQKAGSPFTTTILPPNVAPALAALAGLETAQSAAAQPVTTAVVAPNIGPAVAALNVLDTEKQQAAQPVSVPVLVPQVGPAITALGTLDAAKIDASSPVVVPVVPPNVGPATAALAGLETAKAEASAPIGITVTPPAVGPAVAGLESIGAAKATVAQPASVTVGAPNVAPVVAALGVLEQEKAKVAQPVTVPIPAPNIAPAVTALSALDTAKQQTSVPVTVPIAPPVVAPTVAVLGALEIAKVAASAPVTTPVVAPNVAPVIVALDGLQTAKATVGQPLTVPVVAPAVAPAVAALGALQQEKAIVATPLAFPVTVPNVGPAVAGLGALEGAKAVAAGPVVVTVPTPNVSPAVAALAGLEGVKVAASAPVTTPVTTPDIAPAVAALGGLTTAKTSAGTPVTVSVVAPDIGPATAALGGLETAKAKVGTPIAVPVSVPGVETATVQVHAFVDAAGRLRDASGRFLAMSAEVQAAFAGIDRAKLKAGSPVVLTVHPPNVGPAVAGLGEVDAAKAKVSAPVVIPVQPPNVAPAIAGLSALAEAQALQSTRAAALTAALAQVATGAGTVAERAQVLRAALDADAASTDKLSTAARTLAIADREGMAVIQLRTRATNELIAAQNALSRAQSTGAQVRAAPLTGGVVNPIAVGPQLGPATPDAEAFAARARATGAAFTAQAQATQQATTALAANTQAAQQAGAAHAGLATRVTTAGNATQALSPKFRSAANGMAAVTFAAMSMGGSFQSMALGAGLAASSLATMATGPLALWAAGIGAAVVVLGTLVAVLHEAAKAAPVTQRALEHIGKLDRITATQIELAKVDGQIRELNKRIEEGAGTDFWSRFLPHKRPDDVSLAQDFLDTFGLSSSDLRRLRTKLEERQAIIDRADEVRRDEEKAVAAAQREAGVSAAGDQLRITQSLIDRQESLNSQGYALGQIRLNEFFDARQDIIERRLDAEIAFTRARLASLQDAKAPVGEKPDETIQRRAQRDSAAADLRILQEQRRRTDQQLMAEREAAERALTQRILGFERQRLEAQGKTHEARMQQIALEVEAFARTLGEKKLSDDPFRDAQAKADMVTALRDALTAQEKFNEEQRKAGRIFEEMGLEREAIQRQVEAGQLNEFQGQQAIAAAERARIPDLQKITAEMERFARELKNEDLLNAAKALGAAIGAIGRVPLGPLAARLKSIMDELSLDAGAGDQWAKSILAELQAAVARNGGKVTVGIAVQAEWAINIKRQIEEEFARLDILLKPKNILAEGFLGAIQNLNQQLSGLALNVGNAIGTALAAGFSSAFTKGSGKSFFEQAGLSILSGIGNILVQLGSAMLTYGLLMAAGLPLLLATPFAGQALSAPAAIAAGTGLIALGAGMGAIAANNTGTRTGGGGSGGARSAARAEIPTQRVILDPDRRLREAREVAPRVSVNESARASTTMAQYVYAPVILGNADPQAQRWVVDAFDKGKRRNLGR